MRIISTTAGQTDENLYYVASDYLGSISGLMDETGFMQQEYSYDACSVKYGFWKRSEPKNDISPIPRCEVYPREGARRDPATWQNYNQTQLTTYSSSLITDRGYTGHEMLDLFGLINMNGRLYDPLVGRFLSADPVLQDPANAQNYNKYSYVLNNPLKYTDPSGCLVSGGYYAPDMNGVNSSLQWANNSYYTDLYGTHDFWNGGKYLTRIQNYGGGNGVVWDGTNPENATVFLPGNLFDDGSAYVDGLSPSGSLASGYAVKYSAQRLAEAILNGEVAWERGYGYSTVEKLEASNSHYFTFPQIDKFVSQQAGLNIPIESIGINIMSYYVGVMTTLRQLKSANNLNSLLAAAKSAKTFIGKVPKSTRFAIDYENSIQGLTKYSSKRLFVIGTVLTAVDMVEDPSTDNLLLGTADILMGTVSFAFPIMGLVYFTGRIAYDIYSEEQEAKSTSRRFS